MSESVFASMPLAEFALWAKSTKKRIPFSFGLELTPRCNNACRHCYINLPAGDRAAKEKELSVSEIKEIVDEAVSLGSVWCLMTGGEPLLRENFAEIYTYIRTKGLLPTVFTNAALVNEEHIRLFKEYRPRDIEVSVYGVTKETYERITNRPGSFAPFMRGLELLLENGIRVRLKAVALQSNVHEMPAISRFCEERTKDFFRFDPFIHLRVDGDQARNEEIKSERLSPEEIVALEQADPTRSEALAEACNRLIVQEFSNTTDDRLFHCGAGIGRFHVSYDGIFRLCSSLCRPDCVYDLRKGSLTDAWRNFVPGVRGMRSKKREFLENCRRCPIINLCFWCPANAYLETGEMDARIDYFCKTAHTRAAMLSGI